MCAMIHPSLAVPHPADAGKNESNLYENWFHPRTPHPAPRTPHPAPRTRAQRIKGRMGLAALPWLLLAALLLAGNETAWGQTDKKPSITVTPKSITINLQPSKPTQDVLVHPLGAGDFNYKATGSPRPKINLAATSPNAPAWNAGEQEYWATTFIRANVGTHTYALTATNLVGSATTTFTVTVTWKGDGGAAPNRRTNNIVVPGYRRINLRNPATWSSSIPSRLQ